MKWKYKRGFARCKACDKDLYRTRKEARRQARVAHPGVTMNAYYCPLGNGYHYGHLPDGGRDRAREILDERYQRHVRRHRTTSITSDQSGAEEGASLASGETSGNLPATELGEDSQVLLGNALEREEGTTVD